MITLRTASRSEWERAAQAITARDLTSEAFSLFDPDTATSLLAGVACEVEVTDLARVERFMRNLAAYLRRHGPIAPRTYRCPEECDEHTPGLVFEDDMRTFTMLRPDEHERAELIRLERDYAAFLAAEDAEWEAWKGRAA